MNQKYIIGGVVGGLVAGVVFGLMSQATGMMPMIAMLVKSQSVTVGWVVHLIVSVAGGVVFAAVFGRFAHTYSKASAWGLLYGVIWWFFGMLIAMPAILGMPTEVAKAFDQMNVMSLYGHLLWGLLLGLIFVLYARENMTSTPKEMWRSTWPFAAIAVLLLVGGLGWPAMGSGAMPMSGSSMDMQSSSMPTGNGMGSGSMDNGAGMGQTSGSMPMHQGTMPMQQ